MFGKDTKSALSRATTQRIARLIFSLRSLVAS